MGLIRTAMGEPGPDGRRRPRPVAGSEFELPADVLIMAFGFQAHAMPWLQGSGIKLDKWGLIQTGDVGYLPTQTHLKKSLLVGMQFMARIWLSLQWPQEGRRRAIC